LQAWPSKGRFWFETQVQSDFISPACCREHDKSYHIQLTHLALFANSIQRGRELALQPPNQSNCATVFV